MWLHLVTRDAFDAAIFYGEVLGWTSPGCCDVRYEDEEVVLVCAGQPVAALGGGAPGSAPDPRVRPHWQVRFTVRDATVCARAAVEHGGAIMGSTRGQDGRLRDPARPRGRPVHGLRTPSPPGHRRGADAGGSRGPSVTDGPRHRRSDDDVPSDGLRGPARALDAEGLGCGRPTREEGDFGACGEGGGLPYGRGCDRGGAGCELRREGPGEGRRHGRALERPVVCAPALSACGKGAARSGLGSHVGSGAARHLVRSRRKFIADSVSTVSPCWLNTSMSVCTIPRSGLDCEGRAETTVVRIDRLSPGRTGRVQRNSSTPGEARLATLLT